MNLISRVWRRLRLLYLFLLPIRFSLLALVAAAFAFTVAAQGADIVRALGEVDPGTGSAHWGAIALFLALLNLLAYQIWFCARQMLRVEQPPSADDAHFGRTPDPEDAEFRPWALWLPRILGALLFVAMLWAFYNVRCTYGDHVKTVNTTVMVLIAVSFVVFLLAVVLRRRWLERSGRLRGSIAHVRPAQLAASARGMLMLSLILAVVFFVVSTVAPTRLMGFGAGSLVLLTLSLWVPFGSLIVYAGMRMRAPILTLLVLLAFLVSPIADHNHIIRTAATSKGVLDSRPTVDERLEQWHSRVAPFYGPGEDIPIFIVATEGGGIRAAYWTAAVLDSLQDTQPLFSRNLFAVSGVSGGSLGTMTFSALLSESARTEMHRRGSAVLGHDFLTPTLAAMTQPDFIQRFLPVGFPDREKALEEGWERGYVDELQTPTFQHGLLDLYAKHPELPNVFINGTMVETGDRIITSNCRIHARPKEDGVPPPLLVFRNAYDGLDLLGSDLPLSATAGMSARFTYVSPAGRIPGPDGSRGHVVDGGYFENSGAVTAAEIVLLIDEVSQRNHWHLVPVVVLIDFANCSSKRQSCAGELDLAKLRPGRGDDYAPFPAEGVDGPAVPAVAERWANEVLSPVRALLNTRDARGEQAVGDIRTAALFEGSSAPPTAAAAAPGQSSAGNPTLIEFRLVQTDIPIPLGWMLSRQSQYAIDSAVEKNGNRWARDTIGKWLHAPIATDPLAVLAKQQLQTVRE